MLVEGSHRGAVTKECVHICEMLKLESGLVNYPLSNAPIDSFALAFTDWADTATETH